MATDMKACEFGNIQFDFSSLTRHFLLEELNKRLLCLIDNGRNLLGTVKADSSATLPKLTKPNYKPTTNGPFLCNTIPVLKYMYKGFKATSD